MLLLPLLLLLSLLLPLLPLPLSPTPLLLLPPPLLPLDVLPPSPRETLRRGKKHDKQQNFVDGVVEGWTGPSQLRWIRAAAGWVNFDPETPLALRKATLKLL